MIAVQTNIKISVLALLITAHSFAKANEEINLTLQWRSGSSPVDLDFSVTSPLNETVNYANRTSNWGAQFILDDRGTANSISQEKFSVKLSDMDCHATGRYTFYINHYSGPQVNSSVSGTYNNLTLGPFNFTSNSGNKIATVYYDADKSRCTTNNANGIAFEFIGLYDTCNKNGLKATKCQVVNTNVSARVMLQDDGTNKSKISFTFLTENDLPTFYFVSLPSEVKLMSATRMNFKTTGLQDQNQSYSSHVLKTIVGEVAGKVFGVAKLPYDLFFGYTQNVGDPSLLSMFRCADVNSPLCVSDENMGSYVTNSGYGKAESPGATVRFTYHLGISLDNLKTVLKSKGIGFYAGSRTGAPEVLLQDLKFNN